MWTWLHRLTHIYLGCQYIGQAVLPNLLPRSLACRVCFRKKWRMFNRQCTALSFRLAVTILLLTDIRPELCPQIPSTETMADLTDFKTLGFIGLGAMGRPMLEHLANKLPEGSRLWVYDVVEQVLDEVCAAFPNRVLKGTSAADVAQHVVCYTVTKDMTLCC